MCMANAVAAVGLYVAFGFDRSGNVVLFALLPFLFLLYYKNTKEDLQKLLFVFCMVIHAASIIGGAVIAVRMLAEVLTDGSARAGAFVEILVILITIAYFLVIGRVVNRTVTPRLRRIDPRDMKRMWIVPVLLASIPIFYYTFYPMQEAASYLVPVVFIPLTAVSFAVYGLILGMLDNITESSRMKTESLALERAGQLKTEIMRTISHETRTPLAIIRGFAELTAEAGRKSGMERELLDNLDAIAAESVRMANMMEEMRQIALAKEYPKDRRPVDIGGVIRQITGLYTLLLERKGTSLEVNIAENLPPVYGNDNELTQVVHNLLRNAEMHTQNCKVNIRAVFEGGSVKVTVSDTGTGMPPDLLPRVFERGVSGSKEGSGYGLNISQDIIHAYGGEIWLESEQGKGTQAVFTLPAYKTAGGNADEL